MVTSKKECVTLNSSSSLFFKMRFVELLLLLLNSLTSSFTEITQFLLSKEEVSGEMILRYL